MIFSTPYNSNSISVNLVLIRIESNASCFAKPNVINFTTRCIDKSSNLNRKYDNNNK